MVYSCEEPYFQVHHPLPPHKHTQIPGLVYLILRFIQGVPLFINQNYAQNGDEMGPHLQVHNDEP